MLQSIRDSLSGWIVWVIVGLIVIPFAFWGVESFTGGGGDPVVAKVGGQKITQSQFRAGYEQRYEQLQSLMGKNFRADMIDPSRFSKSVLDDMVQELLMRQYANKAGYYADDTAVYNYLVEVPAFQENGKFSDAAYKRALGYRGLSSERFESQLRSSIEIDQMRNAVIDTAFVTDAGASQAYRLDNEERALSYAEFDYKKYLGGITVGDDQVKARYEASKTQYMAPERVKLAYVELSMDDLPKAEPPKADVLKVIYDADKDSRFATIEQRRARHILIAYGADKAAAKQKIEAIAAQIKNGADFAALAKADSDDPGSKAQGGELGWIQKGQMVKSFDQALFALKPGEISAPVQTEYGWHLIQLEELKSAHIKPFDDPEVQKQLVDLYQQRDLQKRFQAESDKLEQLAFENPASLDAVAKALNLKIQTTDWFTRAGGEGITANDAVKQAAFTKETLSDGDNSKPIALAPGKQVVIRKADYQAARQKTLQEVADTVRSAIATEQAKAKAMTEAQQMAAAARAGRPLAELASARGVSLKTPGMINRSDTTVDKDVTAALFRLPRPAKQGDISAAAIPLGDGDAAVVVLTEVKEPSWPPQDASIAQRSQQQLRDLQAGQEFADYGKAVTQQIKVKMVNPPVAGGAAPDS